ncbi:RNA polymerase II transcription factor B subunit 1 [Mortierella alpina]|nr:RNA polymerase II transcription factor B subunit 1 [Mortierella alpina]
MWEAGETITTEAPALFKKRLGTAFLTNRRLAWVPQGGLAPMVSVKHMDIKTFFVSKENAAKVMVKVVENRPDASHSFEFPSSNAAKERDAFKDAITAVISARQARTAASTPAAGGSSPLVSDASAPGTPKTSTNASRAGPIGVKRPLNGGAAAAELRVRVALLTQDKDLATLHKDLVIGKHVSEEEFWESRKHLLRNKTVMDQQQKGQSSAWLDLKPETGESNDVKYVMTPQVIHSIFQQYPAIKRKYDENVPDILSEGEFWKRFFQSRFFHRSRSGRGANEPDDDIFDRALEEDEEETKNAPKRIRLDHIDKLLDLSTTEEDHLESYTSPDSTMAAGKTKGSKEAIPLIRRFNRYAQRVLNSTVGPKRPSTGSEPLNMSGVERAIVLDDLQEQKEASRIVLDIQDTRRYFESQGGDLKSSKIPDNQDPADILDQFYRDFASHRVVLNRPFTIPPSTFDTLMKDVKVNRAKMMPPQDGSQLLPPQLYQDALACHAAGNEILRHFWSSTGADKAAKYIRMVESLKKVRDENVKALLIQASSLDAACLEALKMMLKPMLGAIQKALKHAETRPKPMVDTWLKGKYKSEKVPDFEMTQDSYQLLLLMMQRNEVMDKIMREAIEYHERYSDLLELEENVLRDTLQVFNITRQNVAKSQQAILSQLSDLALVLGLSDMSLSSFHQGLAQVRLDTLESTREHAQQQKRLDSLVRHRIEAQTKLDKLTGLKRQWTDQRESGEGDLELRTKRRSTELNKIKAAEDRTVLADTLASRQQRRNRHHHQQQHQQQHQHQRYKKSRSSVKDTDGAGSADVDVDVEGCGLTLAQLDLKEKSVEELEQLLSAQTTSLAAYQEIPPDYALARLKVKEATMRLEQLTLEHESMVAQLAEDL